MKKLAIVALALAAFSQASFAGWSAQAPITQYNIHRGCGNDLGKTFLWVVQSGTQYLANSTQPDFAQFTALAMNATANKQPVSAQSYYGSAAFQIIAANGNCATYGTGFYDLTGFAAYPAP